MNDIKTIRGIDRGLACVDIHCAGGLIIRKGQSVRAELQFSREWPCGGFRTVFNGGLDFANADAFDLLL
jgi:hypothetical protein